MGGLVSLFTGPKTPKVPKVRTPKTRDVALSEEESRRRQRLAATQRYGQSQTILTGGLGITEPALTTQKTAPGGVSHA